MTGTTPLIAVLAAAICLIALPGKLSTIANASAQEKPAAAQPVPEMQRLAKFYVGTWDYTENYPKSASAPEGLQNTGIYTSELGPGGNSLVNHFLSHGPVGVFEGMIVMTWDPKEKAYKEYLFGNESSGAIIETGQWQGDALVYRGEFAAGATKIALRTSAKLTAEGKMIGESFSSANRGPEKLLVRVEATKRP